MDKVLQLDSRRRVSLMKIGRTQDRMYLVDERDDGTLILTPAIAIPARKEEST